MTKKKEKTNRTMDGCQRHDTCFAPKLNAAFMKYMKDNPETSKSGFIACSVREKLTLLGYYTA